MRIRKQQSGFAVLELVLVVVIIAAIVVVGLRIHNRSKTTTTANTLPTNSTQSPVANNVSKAPPVNSTSDLDNALNTLNQNDPPTANSADSSQLSSQASTF